MDDLRNIIRQHAAELKEEKKKGYAPRGIGERIGRFFLKIQPSRERSAFKKIGRSVNGFNAGGDCQFYPIQETLYAGYYKNAPEGPGMVLFLSLESLDEEGELKILLPLIADREQAESMKAAGLEFWGAHPVVRMCFGFRELVSSFGRSVRKALGQAAQKYRYYSRQLEADPDYLLSAVYRMDLITLYDYYADTQLAGTLFERIPAERERFRMPEEGQETKIGVGSDNLQNLDLLVSGLLRDRLVTGITRLAWHYAKDEIQARHFAELALEMGDPEAQEVLSYLEDRDDFPGLYSGEIRNMWRSGRGGTLSRSIFSDKT